MSESQTALVPAADAALAATPAKMQSFSFGDPTPVLDRRELLDYIECYQLGKWYEPPVSFDGLAKCLRSSPHHSSSIYIKRNILAATFRPHALLNRGEFGAFALDFLTFGNAYLERVDNLAGRPLQLRRSMAKYTRRGVEAGRYFFTQNFAREHEFRRYSIFHLLEPDVHQEIYGLPEYLSAIQSALLNESSTLFRRRYYVNGSHAGYILYINDAAQSQDDVDAMREALRNSKGPGNFRNLFLYSPNGKKDGVQVIPISEVAAKDEFMGIKEATRDDILAAHRVPPQLLGIVPKNAGGFGDVEKAAKIFVRNEIAPLQERFRGLNDWIGAEVMTFDEYAIPVDSPAG